MTQPRGSGAAVSDGPWLDQYRRWGPDAGYMEGKDRLARFLDLRL